MELWAIRFQCGRILNADQAPTPYGRATPGLYATAKKAWGAINERKFNAEPVRVITSGVWEVCRRIAKGKVGGK